MLENNPSTVAIIDDDQKSIEIIRYLIDTYCPGMEVVGSANNIEEGAKVIISDKPEIVFLDVEMPGGTGFDLLEMIKIRDFDVIFITAHNKYAISAIKHSALDYLLKPIETKEFMEDITFLTAVTRSGIVLHGVLS